jgi:UDP-2,3-diacylglucosamine pyrophosphatase LpxH
MPGFEETLGAFTDLLRRRGYTMQPTEVPGQPGKVVRCVFSQAVFQDPVLAIPDVHLADGRGGDIFMDGHPDAIARLVAVLQAIEDFIATTPLRTVQLGDWFDVWRAEGGDVRSTNYGAIQNANVYRSILDLDARIGLTHVIGNHDASFLRALPDRRAAQPALFGLGFWLGNGAFAIHGHQTDIAPPPNSPLDQFFVAAATTVAEFAPGVTSFEAYIDRYDGLAGVVQWLLSGFGLLRPDPPIQPRPPDAGPLPEGVVEACLVVRESRDDLTRLARAIEALPSSQGRSLKALLVGHSHKPCISVSRLPGAPVVIIDAGSWTYGQANVLLAADNTAAVFDVVRSPA